MFEIGIGEIVLVIVVSFILLDAKELKSLIMQIIRFIRKIGSSIKHSVNFNLLDLDDDDYEKTQVMDDNGNLQTAYIKKKKYSKDT